MANKAISREDPNRAGLLPVPGWHHPVGTFRRDSPAGLLIPEAKGFLRPAEFRVRWYPGMGCVRNSCANVRALW